MLQQEKQDDLSIDQIINIVNFRGKQLKPITASAKQNRTHLFPSDNSFKQKQPLNIKTLLFKPWSGQEINDAINYQSHIKEQIDGIQQERQDEDQQDMEDRDHVEKEVVDNASQITNMAKHDQIGYFYKFQNAPVKLIKKLLDQNGFKYANTNKNWTIYWSSSVIKMQTYHALLPYQKINHFPNSFHLTRKDLMNKCISKMQIKYGITNFNFLPKTFILPAEMGLLKDEISKNNNITYIVKPHNRSQGKGITVTNSLATIYSKLQKYSSLIVSHYIDNPLLINNLKFDLRIYVAITGVNPLRIYVYDEGLGRFATQAYDETATDCQNKKYQHLTNYSVNKKNVQFVKSQNQNDDYFGSKWSLTALKDFLKFNVGITQTEQLFERIDDVIVKTILSGQNILHTSFINNVPYNNSCFEVLGFDILIDSNLKPWLMEVNMSPSMNSDSPIDIKIKGHMISDLFTMIGVSPLNQRYLDGNHIRYDIKNYLKPENKQVELGLLQKFLVKEIKSENERRGAWKRVFPNKYKKYTQFFEVDRYFNRLIREQQFTYDQIKERNNYNSVNERDRGLLGKPKNQIKNNYMSVNDRKRVDSREKSSNFAIRIQQKKGSKKVYI